MRFIHWFLPATLLLGGCAATTSVAPPVSPAMVGASHGATADTLNGGRRIFTTQCTACHSADPVGKHSVAEWRRIVGDMSHRAKLNAAQEQALLAYLIAARETPVVAR